MIAIIDYGAGNLFSVKNALDFLKIDNIITNKAEEMEQSSGLILPGVGAFPDAMHMINNSGLLETIRTLANKKPFLGICLGMQLLFEIGYEFGACEGLGLIKGSVTRITDKGLKIPHMGWNSCKIQNACPLTEGIPDNSYFYFVHSFRAQADSQNISTFCEYGEQIPALVFRGNIYGAQFHPEKSAEYGLTLLKNFGGLCR